MKANSKKLLLWLYPLAADDAKGTHQKRQVPVEQVDWILADLTAAGRQSLVRLLTEKQLLFSDDISGQSRLTISSHGRSQLEADFPVLTMQADKWTGSWTMLLFLDAPQSDPRFRYLRNLLVKQHWFSIKRGVYLHPQPLPVNIKQTLENSYRGAVVVVEFEKWQFGDEIMVIGQKTNLTDLKQVYSGISNEIEQLLSKLSKSKRFSLQQKQQFFSVYNRLFQTIETDLGLVKAYYPEAVTGIDCLQRLQAFSF